MLSHLFLFFELQIPIIKGSVATIVSSSNLFLNCEILNLISGWFHSLLHISTYSSAFCLLLMRVKYISNIVPMLDLFENQIINQKWKIEARIINATIKCVC